MFKLLKILRGRPNDRRGVSLLEMMVAMGIFLLVLGGLTSILLFSFSSRNIIWEQLITQNEGRLVVQVFVNELRSANQSSVGAYTIEKAESNQLIFFSNIDSDSYRERIRYFLSGSYFKKGVTKPAGNPLTYDTSTEAITTIAHDVANSSSTPIFTYYSQTYISSVSSTPLPSPVTTTLIRVVGVQLILEEDPRFSPVPLTIQAKAEIRNLKDN